MLLLPRLPARCPGILSQLAATAFPVCSSGSTSSTSACCLSNLQQHSLLASSSEATSSATPTQTFKQRRLIGWTPEQVYNVVSDVDNYNKFVPWCIGSRVLRRNKDGTHLDAELEVGFQLLREKYISKVTLIPQRAVTSTVQNSALFHRLDSTWGMDPGMVPKSCWISFQVEFAFQRATYNHVVSLFFSEVTRRMMSAFEGRCEELYGPSTLVRNIRPPTRARDRGYHTGSSEEGHRRTFNS
uniref:Coenzyme Q-binding protein COQ10 START domain-containing protein n=1 Tax=Dunaliella tertiolecta TaxID=3047 RepID=A0A7S3VQJ8_DUNTE